MIIFELSMPHKGSWNNKWTGEGRRYIRVADERLVPKDLWGKDFFYRWDDGWEACVSVSRMSSCEARKLEKKSDGFCGYDWMISSIIRFGKIIPQSEWNKSCESCLYYNKDTHICENRGSIYFGILRNEDCYCFSYTLPRQRGKRV